MKKTEKIQKNLESNLQEIKTLESFRQTKQVKQLLRSLFAEQSFLRKQFSKLQKITKKSPQERQNQANKQRSEKMRRSWNYFKAIHKNYDTGMSLRQIRASFSRHKKGLESDISDVIWRNPSP